MDKRVARDIDFSGDIEKIDGRAKEMAWRLLERLDHNPQYFTKWFGGKLDCNDTSVWWFFCGKRCIQLTHWSWRRHKSPPRNKCRMCKGLLRWVLQQEILIWIGSVLQILAIVWYGFVDRKLHLYCGTDSVVTSFIRDQSNARDWWCIEHSHVQLQVGENGYLLLQVETCIEAILGIAREGALLCLFKPLHEQCFAVGNQPVLRKLKPVWNMAGKIAQTTSLA